MHIKQTDTLIKDEKALPEKELHWLVMQSLKYKKWVLAVMCNDFSEYSVTELMSENPEIIVQYAEYLNRGKIGSVIDRGCRLRLDRLRETYQEGMYQKTYQKK